MRVLPVPGGSERKDRNEPGRSGTGSVECGVQMLMWVTGSSAAPVVDMTHDLIHESAMSRRLGAVLARLLLVYYSVAKELLR